MWLKPEILPTNDTSIWEDIKEAPNVKLQKVRRFSWTPTDDGSYRFNIMNNVNSVASAIFNRIVSTPMDENSQSFRIIAHSLPSRVDFVLFHTNNKTEAKQEWDWFVQTVASKFADINNLYDYEIFLLSKVNQKVTLERQMSIKSTDNKQSDSIDRIFRSTFNTPHTEILIAHFKCSYMGKSRICEGIVFFSTNFICFLSQQKSQPMEITIPFLEIKSIKQDLSVTNYGEVIIVKNSNKISRFNFFGEYKGAFNLLLNIYNRCLKHLSIASFGIEESEENELIEVSKNIDDNNRLKQKQRTPLDEIGRRKLVREVFGLNKTEVFLEKYPLTCEMQHPDASCILKGIFIKTQNFICFFSKEDLKVKVSLPLWEISEIHSTSNPLVEKSKTKLLIMGKSNIFYVFFSVPTSILQEIEEEFKNYVSPKLLSECNEKPTIDRSPLLFRLAQHSSQPHPLNDKWNEHFSSYGRCFGMYRTPELNKLVKRGIPDLFRGEIWTRLCGAESKSALFPQYYETLLAEHKLSSVTLDEIERDLRRSLPDHPALQSDDSIDSLKRVLMAYASHNPSIGYAQSMNIIASTLLMLCTEEQTFWLLAEICDRILPNYFSRNMVGALIDREVFLELLVNHFPELHVLSRNQSLLDAIVYTWFLTLFINAVSFDGVFRILDWFFLDGIKSLFLFAIAAMQSALPETSQLNEELDVVTYMNKFVSLLSFNSEKEEESWTEPLNLIDTTTRIKILSFETVLELAHSHNSKIGFNCLKNYREKCHLKVLKKMQESVKKSIFKSINLVHRVPQEELEIVFSCFKTAHHMSKIWTDCNSYKPHSWKMAIDNYLVDLKRFTSLFTNYFWWGKRENGPNLAMRIYRLVTSESVQEGLMNFQQFIQLYYLMAYGTAEKRFMFLYKLNHTQYLIKYRGYVDPQTIESMSINSSSSDNLESNLDNPSTSSSLLSAENESQSIVDLNEASNISLTIRDYQPDDWTKDVIDSEFQFLNEKEFMSFWKDLSSLTVNLANESEIFMEMYECNQKLFQMAELEIQNNKTVTSTSKTDTTISESWKISWNQIFTCYTASSTLIQFMSEKHAEI